MTKKGKRRRGMCEICGVDGFVSRDHLPPESFFEKPLPTDLFSVAACDSCNNGSSEDDEYFRNAVCLSEYRGNSRHAIAGCEKAIRSLKRSHRHRAEFLRATKRVLPRDANDEDERTRLAFTVEAERINAVVRRISRGVFYKETGCILPTHINVTVDTPETFDLCDQETQEMMVRTILNPLESVSERSFAGGLFRYKFMNPNAGSYAAVWRMVLYNKLPVLCLSRSLDIEAPT